MPVLKLCIENLSSMFVAARCKEHSYSAASYDGDRVERERNRSQTLSMGRPSEPNSLSSSGPSWTPVFRANCSWFSVRPCASIGPNHLQGFLPSTAISSVGYSMSRVVGQPASSVEWRFQELEFSFSCLSYHLLWGRSLHCDLSREAGTTKCQVQ